MRQLGTIQRLFLYGMALIALLHGDTLKGSVVFDVGGLSGTNVRGQSRDSNFDIVQSITSGGLSLKTTALSSDRNLFSSKSNYGSRSDFSLSSSRLVGEIVHSGSGNYRSMISMVEPANTNPTSSAWSGGLSLAARGRGLTRGSVNSSAATLGLGLQSLAHGPLDETFLTGTSYGKRPYALGVRPHTLGANELSDFAVPIASTSPVPAPGAALLAGVGLGIAGLILRRRNKQTTK